MSRKDSSETNKAPWPGQGTLAAPSSGISSAEAFEPQVCHHLPLFQQLTHLVTFGLEDLNDLGLCSAMEKILPFRISLQWACNIAIAVAHGM